MPEAPVEEISDKGSIIVKNVSGSNYTIVECGHSLADQAEHDLMKCYREYEHALKLVEDCPDAQLCQDIEAGLVEVTTKRTPSV